MLHYTTIITTHYNYAVVKMSVLFTFSRKQLYTLMMSKINIDYNDFYTIIENSDKLTQTAILYRFALQTKKIAPKVYNHLISWA